MMIMDMYTTQASLPNYYEVRTNSLNVRAGAGTSYKIIGKLQRYDLVNVINIKGKWAKIKYNSKYGYVSVKYLRQYTDGLESWKCTTSARVNMRNKPTTKGSYVILKIPKGTRLEVQKESNGWLKVNYKGHTGWISGMYAK